VVLSLLIIWWNDVYSDRSMRLKIGTTLVIDDEEAILLNEIQQNPEGFTILYRRYLPRVYRYLYFKTGDANDAEELTSQVFLAALEGMPRYHHRGRFSTWLFSIARRKAADFYRAQYARSSVKFSPSATCGLTASDPEDDPLTQVIAQENLNKLNELLAVLQDDEKELLRLRFAGKLQFSEIATLLKRKPSSIKMIYYRLLARLASKMEA
jgi:RNA polymerase sigma-70 factor (ECF subfamily)